MPVEVEVKARRITPSDISAINSPEENKAPVYNQAQGRFEWRDVGSPGGGGDMLKSVYDANSNGVVDNSERLESYDFNQVRDHAPRTHGNECHSATFLTTCDKYTKAAQDALGIDAATLEGQDLAGARNHVPRVHGNECHSATFLTTCDKYTKAAQDALGIDAATLDDRSLGTTANTIAYYDAWGRVVDTNKIGGTIVNPADIADSAILYATDISNLAYTPLPNLIPALNADGKLILTGSDQIGTKTGDLAELWDKSTKLTTSDLATTEFNLPNKIPTLDASTFLALSQVVGNIPGLNAEGKLVFTEIDTKVTDLDTLWTKATKLLITDINSAEFNVANKLLKLDANAKVPYAQMPALGGTATFVVAASNSENKDKADYVCTGTDDQGEIMEAIGDLPANGGSIVLLEGAYTIDANNDPIKINTVDNVTIQGQGKGTKICLDTGVSSNIIEVVNASGVTIKDLCVDGTTTAASGGVGIYQCGVLFDTVTYSNIIDVSAISNKMHGLHIYDSSLRIEVSGCECTDNTEAGILLNTSEDIIVGANTCYSNDTDGVQLHASTNSTVVGNNCSGNLNSGIYLDAASNYNTINGNTCGSNTMNGIYLYNYVLNITVTGNTCYNNTLDGIFASSNILYCTISGNTCRGNGRHGVQLSTACNDNSILGNACTSNTAANISLNSCSRNVVDGNMCLTSSSSDGITIASESLHNTIGGNTCAINFHYGIYLQLASNSNTIVGNSCYYNESDGINIATLSNHNIISGNTSQNNLYHGIEMSESSNNTITDNTCVANSQSITNTQDNISVTTDSNYNNIQGNTSRSAGGAKVPRYGINVADATCNGNMVTNNDVHNDGFGTGTINDSGTGTVTAAGNRT
ncbi:MAG: right-handed parallel beta-helix repeat-containing protein [Euryarchaeota archaeon]|nr:right-handed parallel beta-helix repeat-containing protein [Euryarchaeota archaeon]